MTSRRGKDTNLNGLWLMIGMVKGIRVECDFDQVPSHSRYHNCDLCHFPFSFPSILQREPEGRRKGSAGRKNRRKSESIFSYGCGHVLRHHLRHVHVPVLHTSLRDMKDEFKR